MIPKQLFFIWVGDTQPNYVQFSIDNFKKVNPDFKVDLILEKDIYCKNKDFEIVRECIENKSCNEYNEIIYGQWAKNNIKTDKGKISRFVDCLKIHYINKYGGIYLDCDTFPLKKFDNDILDEGFCCYNNNVNGRIYKDRYFMGCCKNEYIKISRKIIFDVYYNNKDYKKGNISEKDKKERDSFFNCTYLPDNNTDYKEYIKHFKSMEWA